MPTPFEQLGLSPTATPDEIKAAYHAKLREFPAHSHPQEFKAIRTAYDAIRKGDASKGEDFFQVRPIEATPDPELLKQLNDKVVAALEMSLEDLIKATF